MSDTLKNQSGQHFPDNPPEIRKGESWEKTGHEMRRYYLRDFNPAMVSGTSYAQSFSDKQEMIADLLEKRKKIEIVFEGNHDFVESDDVSEILPGIADPSEADAILRAVGIRDGVEGFNEAKRWAFFRQAGEMIEAFAKDGLTGLNRMDKNIPDRPAGIRQAYRDHETPVFFARSTLGLAGFDPDDDDVWKRMGMKGGLKELIGCIREVCLQAATKEIEYQEKFLDVILSRALKARGMNASMINNYEHQEHLIDQYISDEERKEKEISDAYIDSYLSDADLEKNDFGEYLMRNGKIGRDDFDPRLD